jgi:Mg2+/citrate symporter
MFWIHIIVAAIVAIVLVLLFAGFIGASWRRRDGAWASIWLLFLIAFLAAWSGGLWIRPIGPPIWGTFWVPFVIAGLLVLLVFAAMAPPRRRPRTAKEAIEEAKDTVAVEATLNSFFWLLLFFLILGVILGYLI